jgi:molecular chaperone DnaK (HSP70)
LGGDAVDEWLMEEWCRRSGNVLEQVRHDLKWRAEALKQRLSRPAAPPDALEGVPFTRPEFIALLEQRGLYRELTQGVEQVLREADSQFAIRNSQSANFQVDDVLLIGGSTLLPGVPERVALSAGVRPRHWRPFEAVARGAALFGAGREVEPILYHDYALRVFEPGLTPQQRQTGRALPGGGGVGAVGG